MRLPLRFMRGSYGRLALTVVAIACGVALVCAIDLADRAVLRAFVEVVDTMAGRVALQVRAGEGSPFPENVVATVAAVPGVERAGPVVSATALTADGDQELLTVLALDVGDKEAVRAYGASDESGLDLDDPFYLFSQPDSAVLTRAFAARRGLAVGDRIDLLTPAGRRTFTIRGLLEPTGMARVHGGNLVVMDVYAAELAFTREGFINRVDVVVERGRDVTAVADAIGRALPAGLHVEAPSQRKLDLEKIMQALHLMMRGVGLLGLAAASLIAFNRLATAFEARAWQLGVLRAVGVRARAVWGVLIAESLLVGGAGVALGIPLGIGLGRLILPVIATTTALTYRLVAPDAELHVRPASLALAAASGLGAALLAAALPAWRAAKLSLCATLAGRGTEQPATGMRSMWAARGLVAASIGGAIAMQSATDSATWGLLATALIVTGTALAARPLVQGIRPLLPGLRWLGGPTGRFALMTVLHSPRRMALAAATLGVGLGSVLWLWTLARSFEQSVVDAIGGGVRADLVVTSSHADIGFVDAPLDAGLLAELREVPGVTAVAGQRLVDWHYAGGPIAIEALDPRYLHAEPLPTSREPLLDEAVARGVAVNVSANFARHFGTRLGDQIELETPCGVLRLAVAGVTPAFISPRGTIQLSRELYARCWHDDTFTLVFLQARPGTSLDAVRGALGERLGARYRLRILSWAEFVDYCAAQVRRAFAGVRILAGLVLLVVLAGLTDTLAASVAERTRELGAIRTVGVRRRQLVCMVLIEGLVVGALGFVLALATGLALGTLWVKMTVACLLGWVLQLHVPYTDAMIAGVMTVGVCLAAALVPARWAARLEPAAALRYE